MVCLPGRARRDEGHRPLRGWHDRRVDRLVRRAAPRDAVGIAGAHVRGWRVGYRGVLPDALLDQMSVADRVGTWRDRLTHPGPTDVITLVAVTGEQVLGFCTVGPARDGDAPVGTGELWALYVDPHHWRGGVGRALDDAAVVTLGATGVVRATLWVLTANDRARAFYEDRGWVADGATRVDRRQGPVAVDLAETRYARPVKPVRQVDPVRPG